VTHVVALSGGKDSTALALRLLEVEPRDYTYICTPTGDENQATVDHWSRLEDLLRAPIVRITNGTLDSWIEHFRALPNHRMRWCTRLLKIEPTMAFLLAHAPVTHYVGLRADEPTREGIYGEVAAMTRYPLREWGWRLKEVVGYLRDRGVKIPARTNCRRCYEQQLPEWKKLWRDEPAAYEAAAAQERATGSTFRSPSRDTWPAPLDALAVEFRRGRTMRGWSDQQDLFDDAEYAACRACSL
jgi:phosphoadenosine phosphosulfate reductase family protein